MSVLLSIDDLHVHIETPIGTAKALNGVSLEVGGHEIVGLIGETGAGKSLTAWSVLGLLGGKAKVVSGRATFEGQDLIAMPESKRRRIRGNELAVIVQNPRGALDPMRTVGRQIEAMNRRHRKVTRKQAAANAVAALRDVGIADAGRRAKAYAHQLSGGMAQRVLIALAMVNEPKLIIADEPTTGLDLTVQAQILDLLRAKVDETGSAILLITHDLGVVANYCDKVAVMFAGRIIEQGSVEEIFGNPRHPYTRALVAASSESVDDEVDAALVTDRVEPPNLVDLPRGCAYLPRCPLAAPECAEPVPFTQVGPGHRALCHFPADPGSVVTETLAPAHRAAPQPDPEEAQA